MHNSNKLPALIAIMALAFTPLTQATVLDFEGFAAGTVIDDEYSASYGVTITGINFDFPSVNNMATIFDTGNYTGGDNDLMAPFSSPNNSNLGGISPGNVLIIHEHARECSPLPDPDTCGSDPDDEGDRPAGYFEIVFGSAVTVLSLDFFDIENVEDGSDNPDNKILFYGTGGLIDIDPAFHTPDTGGDRTWDQLLFNVSGVTSMTIGMGGSGAIDNLVFVPEPATLGLMGLGLIGISFLRRRSH